MNHRIQPTMRRAQSLDRPPLLDFSEAPNLSRMLLNVNVFGSLLYPCRCALCGNAFHMPRPADLCRRCLASLRIREKQCIRCGEPALDLHCAKCEIDPPSFRTTHALCFYGRGQPGYRAIYRWKIEGDLHLGRALGRALSRKIEPTARQIDGIVPVPGRRLPAARRGFDTAWLVAETLQGELPGEIPILGGFIRRKVIWRWGPASQRRRSRQMLRETLYLPGKWTVASGARLLLVDDIMTTGASARRCSDLLLEGGAQQVTVAVIGRTARMRPQASPRPE